MKKLFAALTLTCICFLIFLWGIRDCDTLIPEEEELAKYPELIPFVTDRTFFRGIRHNLDTGIYEFVIKTDHATKEEYFASVDQRVAEYNWVLETYDGGTRVYVETMPSRLTLRSITLNYTNKSEIFIKSEPRYARAKR